MLSKYKETLLNKKTTYPIIKHSPEPWFSRGFTEALKKKQWISVEDTTATSHTESAVRRITLSV
jgi:hypothetical protein